MEFDTQSIWYIVFALTFLAVAIIIYFLYLEIVDIKKKVNGLGDTEETFNVEETEVPELGTFSFENSEVQGQEGHFISLPREQVQMNFVNQQGINGISQVGIPVHVHHGVPSGIPGGIPVNGHTVVQMQIPIPAEGVQSQEMYSIPNDNIQEINPEIVQEEQEEIEVREVDQEPEIEQVSEEPNEIVIQTATYVERCKRILTVGKNKGNECGKIAVENGLCRSHVA